MIPTIVVHGGAGRIADDQLDRARAGVGAAAAAAAIVLRAGGDAQRAVIAAVRTLEDDPTFNAGRGACMTRAGTFELDAGIMRSSDLRIGAVAAVPDLADPILLAEAVMERSDHNLIAGDGAVVFARKHGVGSFGREKLWTEKAQARWQLAKNGESSGQGQADTVGAVAIDVNGMLCAGCSTGGVLMKLPGRVGDSPLPGAGFYAAPALGASCATGRGEAIMTHVAAYEVLRRIADGEAPDAAAAGVCDRAAAGPSDTCGLIVIAPDGRIGVAHRSEHMSWAIVSGDLPVQAGIVRPRAP
jgi:beta-aspartyl-peptidase (threonine type)